MKVIFRFFALILTLGLVLAAFGAVVSGMMFACAGKLVTGEHLLKAVDKDIPAGKMINLIQGKNQYGDEESLAKITQRKLGEETVQKYNLTEENLEKLFATKHMSAFISQKMESAMVCATNGDVFELSNTEIVDAIRKSDKEFTEITGVKMDDASYVDLENSIAKGGVKNIKYNFSEKGMIDGLSGIISLLAIRLDLILYGVAGFCLLLIFLLNLRRKRRVLFYSGLVVLGSGLLFVRIQDGIRVLFEMMYLNLYC